MSEYKRLTEEEFTSIVNTIARKHGFEYGTGSFIPESTGLNTRWDSLRANEKRSCPEPPYVKVEMSDMLSDLGEGPITDYMESLISALAQGKRRADLVPESVIDAISTREWCGAHQPLYLERMADKGKCSESGKGEHVDLDALYRRLVYEGYLDYDSQVKLRWATVNGTTPDDATYCSRAYKVVMVSDALDKEGIDLDVLACIILPELTKVQIGIGPALRDESTYAMEHEPLLRHPCRNMVLDVLREAGFEYPPERDDDHEDDDYEYDDDEEDDDDDE